MQYHALLFISFAVYIYLFKLYRSFYILAPEIAPPNTTVYDHYSTTEMLITWDAIPTDLENGYLLGYRLFYKRYQEAGLELVGEEFIDVILDRFTFQYKMTGLQSYTKYEIYIYGYSAAGDGPTLIVYGGNVVDPFLPVELAAELLLRV